jgi:signal peptidase I
MARPLSQSGTTRSAWKGGALWRNVRAIALPLALFLLIRTFFLEAYRIPSGSMIPALLVGDWLFVNKLRYGPHVPFTKSRLPGYAEPRRGDVIVFVSPPQHDQPQDLTPTLVKRTVAVGGDTIHMREAVLHVNGVAQRQGYGVASGDAFDSVDPLFDWQKPLGLTASRFGPAPAQPSHDNWGPMVVPAGHLFMMGDNRYNSKDGRYWGFVPVDNVRGKPMFVYYAYNADDSDRPLPFITDIRWGRLGHWIR